MHVYHLILLLNINSILLFALFSVRKMEAEVIQMCVNLFNGGEDACGTVYMKSPLTRSNAEYADFSDLWFCVLR